MRLQKVLPDKKKKKDLQERPLPTQIYIYYVAEEPHKTFGEPQAQA